MKFKYLIPLTALVSLVGCLGTESDDKSEGSNLPDGFSATCYWENQQSVQDECGRADEPCIENHYLEVGERAGLEYECSEVGTSSDVVSSSSMDSTSSEVVSSSSMDSTSSDVVSSSSIDSTSSDVVSSSSMDSTSSEVVSSSSMDSTSSEVVSSSSAEVVSSSSEIVISSSEIVISSSLSPSGTFTDSRDNNPYEYVTIGTQVWMAENLAYLPQVDAVADGSEDVGRESESFYYIYDYVPTGANESAQVVNAKATTNYKTYGVLYNWNAAMDGAVSSSSTPSGVQGVCPSGWHLPSNAEWEDMAAYVDNNNGGDKIGNSLKATTGSTSFSGVTATDQFGFSALPAGYSKCHPFGYFTSRGSIANWWSASESSVRRLPSHRLLSYGNGGFAQSPSHKSDGFSVRCLKDTP